MSVYFQSLCSSSGGNCLTLWTDQTRVIFDCGFGSMKRTRAALLAFTEGPERPHGVILSHVHSDHISHYPLRVLQQLDVPVYIHREALPQLQERHFDYYAFGGLRILPFGDEGFSINEFRFTPIELAHHPGMATYGFSVEVSHSDSIIRLVVMTDFCRWNEVVDHLVDADFIFVESNHDLDLLRKYFNPNSRFHLSNPQTAELLCMARKRSRRAPVAVMLGHISPQRNDQRIAIRETRNAFKHRDLPLDFELLAAPLREPSPVVTIR